MKRVNKIKKEGNLSLEDFAAICMKQFSIIIEKQNEHDKKFDEIKITELKQEVEIAHIHTLLGEMNKREERQDDKIANNFYLAGEIDKLNTRVTKLEAQK